MPLLFLSRTDKVLQLLLCTGPSSCEAPRVYGLCYCTHCLREEASGELLHSYTKYSTTFRVPHVEVLMIALIESYSII